MTKAPHTAAGWTIRDALVNALADLDAGRITARHGVIVLSEEDEHGTHARTRFWIATRDAPQAHGLLTIASHRIMAAGGTATRENPST
jgi:hypothetical protein